MVKQNASQEDSVTVKDDARLEGVAIGEKNQVMNQVAAGGPVIQANNSTIMISGDDPRAQQAEASAAAERERQYALSVFELCNKVDLLSIKADASKECPRHLSMLYTALWTRNYERKEREERIGFGLSQPLKPRSAVEWLNQASRLVLLGDPGSGKSTFVKFVALCLAWDHGALLPIMIVLRDFAATALPDNDTPVTVEHLLDYLRSMLKAWGKAECAPNLEAALKRGDALLLFDGLDEVPEAQQRRAQILQAIQAAAIHFPSRILVTSRTTPIRNNNGS